VVDGAAEGGGRMAGIYKRGRVYWARAQRSNREFRRSLKTADKAVAERRLRQWMTELDGAEWGDKPSRTLEQMAERFIKDYNAQTYWASATIKSFFPTSKLPNWLAIAVGYGANGMFGAEENLAKDDAGNVTFDRRDVRRYRQWYLAPDIDLTKIKTRKKGLKFLFTVLSAFKFPAPSLEFSRGRFRVNAIHF
jgi:hypothetical protein